MIKRFVLAILAFCSAAFCWADGAGEVIETYFQFSTWGDDCYEDDSMLMEGECYALVWRHKDLANTVEGLFNQAGEPIDKTKCEILGIVSAAGHDEYDGHQYAYATNSLIQLPHGHYDEKSSSGVYSLFVFDTRVKKGNEWELGGKTSETTVASLRRYGLVTDFENLKRNRTSGSVIGFYEYNSLTVSETFGHSGHSSEGDVSQQYSCASTPVVCSVSFYLDEETLSESRTIDIDQPIGELPRPERAGFIFGGWFTTGGEAVTPATSVTSGMKLYAKWTPVPEPVFASLAITNGTAYLSVTNTVKGQKYDISWVTDILKVFSTTNWVDIEKTGEASVDTPLTWVINLKGQPQGFFRVLTK